MHVFSVESHEQKRKFIKDAHGTSNFHLFRDVQIFKDGGEAFCDVCEQAHEIPSAVDILVSGPSCKNLSKENQRRSDYVTCNLVQYQNCLCVRE